MKQKIFLLAILSLVFIGCSKTSMITVENNSDYRIAISVGNTDYDGGVGMGLPPNTRASFEVGYSGSTTAGFYVAYFQVPSSPKQGFNLWDYFKFSHTNNMQPVAGVDYLVVVNNDEVRVSPK